MAKEYMVGTVDDKPLLIVTVDDTQYFVDEQEKRVFEDKPGLPEVQDHELINKVMDAA